MSEMNGNAYAGGMPEIVLEHRKMTFGEMAVGISFNPGGNPLVNAIKQKAAEYINVLDEAREATSNGEIKRQLSIAITEAQTSQMWARFDASRKKKSLTV